MTHTTIESDDTKDLLSAAQVMKKIRTAQERLAGHARVTPVLTSTTLEQRVGHAVFLKCENFQRVGAFKFRGAFNAMSALPREQRERGVLTYSSGNHAQAIALSGRLLDTPVTIVMPHNAPEAKLAATRGYGARVVLYDPDSEERETVAASLPDAARMTLIPPFDHYEVIAGQGTAAVELLDQIDAPAQRTIRRLLVPVGGGGLLAGCATAVKALAPDVEVIGVEPERADDAARSFRSGRLERIEHADTIADGTRTPSLGVRNFALIRELVDDIITVSEDDIRAAVYFLFQRMKIVVEPSGALGVAAMLAGATGSPSASGVIISGGNVDNTLFANIISSS
ncbi:MAG: pyridoxal-phosphate dependent enzyme [Gammaproteobacteria bacterium]|nr:pyridoxal-phosphate dependent enzyme [Gammaproteobacteria bacterium]